MVMGLTYVAGSPALGSVAEGDNDYTGDGKEVLSDGDTTITWTISTDQNDPGAITFPDTLAGETVTISGIMANASALGGR